MEVLREGLHCGWRGDRSGRETRSDYEAGDHHGVRAMTADEDALMCDVCGRRGARVRRVSRSYGRGQELLVIEDVPVVTCPNCGESYLTAKTLHEIERIKSNRKALAPTRPVGVASFSAA